MSQRRLIKKEKGIALLLTLMILIALSTMSIAMLSIIQTSAKNTARSHLSVITYQAAEAGIEQARIDLIEEIVHKKGDIVTNDLFLCVGFVGLNLSLIDFCLVFIFYPSCFYCLSL